MNLFGKSSTLSEDPEIRQVEKSIAQEAREDQKNLDRNIKALSGAEKSHNKSIRATAKAQQAVDKAVETEYEATKALNRAAHDRDAAIANEATAEKSVKIKQEHEARLEQDLEKRRVHLDEQQQRKAQNDQSRESRLSHVHAQAAAAAESRSASLDTAAGQYGRAGDVSEVPRATDPRTTTPAASPPIGPGDPAKIERPANNGGVYDSDADFRTFM
ncbi:hypothetical protein VTO73DRAFT_7872 [Trametes versicolor]